MFKVTIFFSSIFVSKIENKKLLGEISLKVTCESFFIPNNIILSHFSEAF